MWMFGEPIDIPLRSILTLLSEYPIKTMNVAFFRYLPILNREDCDNDGMDKLLRDTAMHFSECDYTKMPVSPVIENDSLHCIVICDTLGWTL